MENIHHGRRWYGLRSEIMDIRTTTKPPVMTKARETQRKEGKCVERGENGTRLVELYGDHGKYDIGTILICCEYR